MRDRSSQLHRARIVASAGATAIALACGTNYVYSAWAPQFADRLKLSSTESNLIGACGNMGMYLCGAPVGFLIDSRGPRPAFLGGAVLLFLGYFPLHQAYDAAVGSLWWLCICSFINGLGGCMAFIAAIKTSALNWPHHRGTATAFPLAAFGLSAFLFSTVGSVFFSGDTSAFLLLLASGTSGLIALGFFFVRVLPHTHGNTHPPYRALPGGENNAASEASQPLRRTSSNRSRSHTSGPSSEPDIRGFQLLLHWRFWQLFAIMGILAGIGLMTINNVGNVVKALWGHHDDSVDEKFMVKNQQMHVSILSVCSFAGRLLSGVGSDFLVKVLQANRIWCLVAASLIFSIAQVCAITITNPHLLGFVSGLSGLGYGFLFGVFPSIVAETFGVHGLSTNWGFVIIAPVVSGNVFNIFYGAVYDQHSVVGPNGDRWCPDGLECYRSAYLVTLAASALGLAVSLWVIKREKMERTAEAKVAAED